MDETNSAPDNIPVASQNNNPQPVATPRLRDISNVKSLAIFGCVLISMSSVPKIGWVGLVGFIILIFAVKKIADTLGRKDIFKSYLISSICGRLGAGCFLSFAGILAVAIVGASQFFAVSMAALAAAYVLAIVSASFLKKSYGIIAAETGVELFKTAGTLYFIGSIMTIILIGFVLQSIGSLLALWAFIKLPNQLAVKN